MSPPFELAQKRYSFGFNLFNVIVFSNLKILSSAMASDEDLKQRQSYIKLGSEQLIFDRIKTLIGM